MMKKILRPIVGLLCAVSWRAQSEPEKSPAEQASRPPTIHDETHPPAEQSPPPAVAPSPKAGTETSAKPHVETNPPPLDPKNMDLSVKPQDDFYSYANGGWLKRHPISPEYTRWGCLHELIEKNNDTLHENAQETTALF